MRLMRAFRMEQQDPDAFYRMLADDTIKLIGTYAEVRGARVLDAGSGPGDVAEAFRAAGASAVAVDVDWQEMHCRQRTLESAVMGDGMALPFPDGTFDIVCSSNVLEHVPDPRGLLTEMGRVLRPGGVMFAHYTAWFGPWGAHEISPWHYFGADWALRRYLKVNGAPPKNLLWSSLFRIGVGEMLRFARSMDGVDVIDMFPRYLPSWCDPLLLVPGLRELATWNLALVLVRR